MNEEGKPLQWVGRTNPDVLKRMLSHKIDEAHVRPSRMDIEAQTAIVLSKRSTCLFYEVGALLFHVMDKNHFHLSSGYNGAAKGDVDPRHAGCARVVDGELKQGSGLCRGSHAELNAIGNCLVDTSQYADVRMMVTLHPCYTCAKQIVNRNIKVVYYVWEYGREEFVTQYLRDRGVQVERYTSPFLEKWINLNNYEPLNLRK